LIRKRRLDMTARARDLMADTTSHTDAVVVAEPVSAPLMRAAIFLVVTINRARIIASPRGRSARILPAWFARLSSAISKPGSPA
jgi:hypothetical protein